MIYKILGRYQKRGYTHWEEIDSAETMRDAEFMLREYRIAFGNEWNLKIIEVKDE